MCCGHMTGRLGAGCPRKATFTCLLTGWLVVEAMVEVVPYDPYHADPIHKVVAEFQEKQSKHKGLWKLRLQRGRSSVLPHSINKRK